jgi:hypothetical protein
MPEVTVEAPGYPYIAVRINKSRALRNVYWHLVDSAFSLLELGFEWSSKRLTHISIPLYKGAINQTEDVLPQSDPGEPVFDLIGLGFSVDFKDPVSEVIKCEGRIQLNRSGHDLHIRLCPGILKRTVICRQKVIYGFSESNELALICLPKKALLLK